MFLPTERYTKHDIFRQSSEYYYHQMCLTRGKKAKEKSGKLKYSTVEGCGVFREKYIVIDVEASFHPTLRAVRKMGKKNIRKS